MSTCIDTYLLFENIRQTTSLFAAFFLLNDSGKGKAKGSLETQNYESSSKMQSEWKSEIRLRFSRFVFTKKGLCLELLHNAKLGKQNELNFYQNLKQ